MKTKTIIAIAGVFGVVSVGLGALGAHGLKPILTPNQMDSFLTGTKYNMYHALLLFSLIPLRPYIKEKWFKIAARCIVLGTILFSGSIYLLATKDVTGIELMSLLGPITPIGGLTLIIGWSSIIKGALKQKT